MRLINVYTVQTEDFFGRTPPVYAILSHRWRDEEVTLKDMISDTGRQKKGFMKIINCCQQAAKDNISYVWIDTCCIDKSSSAELSEAVNSMFSWYSSSKTCYAYLDDVPSFDQFAGSEWFRRAWTLQELLAPQNVVFFDQDWHSIGTRSSFTREISSITGIPQVVLSERFDVENAFASIAQRMSWASRRIATRSEDTAYSLMGLFGVNIPILYGEGQNAFRRLQEEIIKYSDDNSIFAWTLEDQDVAGLLAPSVKSFKSCDDVMVSVPRSLVGRYVFKPYTMTNKGIAIDLPFLETPVAQETYAAILNCKRGIRTGRRLTVFLRFTHLPHDCHFVRVRVGGQSLGRTSPFWVKNASRMEIISAHITQPHPLSGAIPVRTNCFRVLEAAASLEGGGFTTRCFARSTLSRELFHSQEWLPWNQNGPVGTIIFQDSKTLVREIQVGLDADFIPICRIHSRKERLSKYVYPNKIDDSDWTIRIDGEKSSLPESGIYDILSIQHWTHVYHDNTRNDIVNDAEQDQVFSRKSMFLNPKSHCRLVAMIPDLDLIFSVSRCINVGAVEWGVNIGRLHLSKEKDM